MIVSSEASSSCCSMHAPWRSSASKQHSCLFADAYSFRREMASSRRQKAALFVATATLRECLDVCDGALTRCQRPPSPGHPEVPNGPRSRDGPRHGAARSLPRTGNDRRQSTGPRNSQSILGSSNHHHACLITPRSDRNHGSRFVVNFFPDLNHPLCFIVSACVILCSISTN